VACEICGREPEVTVYIPLHQPNGNLNTECCLECALQSGAWCQRHDTPHTLGFYDGTHACKDCIDEEVLELEGGTDYLGALASFLSASEMTRVLVYLQTVSSVTGKSYETVLRQYIVTVAHRFRPLSRAWILRLMREAGNANLILPQPF